MSIESSLPSWAQKPLENNQYLYVKDGQVYRETSGRVQRFLSSIFFGHHYKAEDVINACEENLKEKAIDLIKAKAKQSKKLESAPILEINI